MNNIIKVGDFRYILNNENNTCACYDVSDRRLKTKYENLIIPREITYNKRNYKVIEIDRNGFIECKSKRIIFPDTLETIGANSFVGCRYLESVYIPKSVKCIQSNCFSECDNLTSVVFEDSIELTNIDFGPYCFYGTKYILELISGGKELGYVGKNLVSIDPNLCILAIEPGTVYAYFCHKRYDYLTTIYIPESLKFLEYKRNSLCNVKSICFETVEHFNSCYIDFYNGTYEKIDIIIGNKLKGCLELSNNIKQFCLDNLNLAKNITNLKLNLNLESIYGNIHYKRSPEYYMRLNNVYFPRGLESLTYSAFRYVNFKEVGVNFSTLQKLRTKFLVNTKAITIYFDDLTNLNSTVQLGDFLNEINYINLVTICKTTSEDLIDILRLLDNNTKLGNWRYRSVILDKDFLKIKDRLPDNYYIPSKGGELNFIVPRVDYPKFITHNIWGEFYKNITTYDDNRSYLVDREAKTCKLDISLEEDFVNSYVGIVKLPEETIIDGEIYKVEGVADFALSNCPYLENIVLQKDQEINESLALYNSPGVKIIRM